MPPGGEHFFLGVRNYSWGSCGSSWLGFLEFLGLLGFFVWEFNSSGG